jgi:carboxymethylenebutenolidase
MTHHQITSAWVDVPVAGTTGTSPMGAYLARPVGPGRFPNVIVGFEMFGLTGYIRAVTDRIAALGYNAIAPDFYHRAGERIDLPATEEGRERGMELLRNMRRGEVRDDVRALLDHLPRREGGGDRTAMVGLSAGGHIAYYAATQLPLAAVAVFYPGWLTDTTIGIGRPEPTLTLTGGIATLGTRLLFLVGDRDRLYTAKQRDQIADRLRTDRVDHEFVVYPDTPHGFFCHERETYRPGAAEDAFARLTVLLAERLPRVP